MRFTGVHGELLSALIGYFLLLTIFSELTCGLTFAFVGD